MMREHLRPLLVQAGREQFVQRFVIGPTAHQRLGLGEEVGHELGMMVAQLVVTVHGADEVGRDELRALMDELIEGVLAIGARLAPDHRTCGVLDRRALARHALAVALHVALLQIGRQIAQRLIIGQHGMRARPGEVGIPDADQAQQRRHVLAQIRRAEMLVHGVRALQKLGETVEADGERDRQPDRRPQRIASADPVPEAEHIGRVDAEGRDLLGIGRDRDEMPRHGR